jgi:four helix bundle protein
MVTYERIQAWQLAHRLALDVYASSSHWPTSERYELTAQVRRAALSVPTNIAEGGARHGPREFRRFLDIALGSLAELSYLLLFARDRGVVQHAEWKELDVARDRAGKATWGLLRSIREGRCRGGERRQFPPA